MKPWSGSSCRVVQRWSRRSKAQTSHWSHQCSEPRAIVQRSTGTRFQSRSCFVCLHVIHRVRSGSRSGRTVLPTSDQLRPGIRSVDRREQVDQHRVHWFVCSIICSCWMYSIAYSRRAFSEGSFWSGLCGIGSMFCKRAKYSSGDSRGAETGWTGVLKSTSVAIMFREKEREREEAKNFETIRSRKSGKKDFSRRFSGWTERPRAGFIPFISLGRNSLSQTVRNAVSSPLLSGRWPTFRNLQVCIPKGCRVAETRPGCAGGGRQAPFGQSLVEFHGARRWQSSA